MRRIFNSVRELEEAGLWDEAEEMQLAKERRDDDESRNRLSDYAEFLAKQKKAQKLKANLRQLFTKNGTR